MQKFGLIGCPLGHSFSPTIHKLIYKLNGIEAMYNLKEITWHDFNKNLLKNIYEEFTGFNVTIPYKSEIIKYLDRVDEEAKNIGAVNTIKKIENNWIGFNTDVEGFLYPLKDYLQNTDVCIVLGTGGGAKAVVYAVLKYIKPKQLIVCGRTLKKAEEFMHEYKAINKFVEIKYNIIERIKNDLINSDLIINATPVGMHPNFKDSLLPNSFSLKEDTIVYDLVYNPMETKLLKQAKENCPECITINGWQMLVVQAVRSIEIWTGKTISTENTINALDISKLTL